MDAIIQAPDSSKWNGRRDQVMFAILYNTGARVSEVIRLKICDVSLNGRAFIRFQGKGRKERVVPLWKSTGKELERWLTYINTDSATSLFSTANMNL